MSSSADYVNYILEQLSCAGLARARRMFGEYGLYLDGMFFAVICDDELFIKPTQAALAPSRSCRSPKGGSEMLLEYKRTPRVLLSAPKARAGRAARTGVPRGRTLWF